MTAATFSQEVVAERVPSFGERFMGMIVRPRATMAGLREPDAWFGAAVMLLAGYLVFYLAMGLGTAKFQASYMSQMATPRGSGGAAPNALQWMLLVMPMSQLVAILWMAPVTAAASWAVRSLLFYWLARLLGGIPPFWGRVVAVVGWAWVPLFLQYVGLGVAMLVFPQVFAYLAGVPEGMEVGQMAQSMRQKWHGQVILYLSPLVIWNLVLCAIGIEDLFQLPRWKAALVVLIPTVLQLLFQGGMYAFSVGIMDAFQTAPGAAPVPNGPGP